MEARRTALAALALCLLWNPAVWAQSLFQAVSTNFVATAPDRSLANRTVELAEFYRREMSLLWLGRELPAWNERCPILVEIAPHAGGETKFTFHGPPGSHQPTDWKMRVFGSPERILDSVLPHEVTHTVFASHFGQPLPRWADEGACTTVEHGSEREKIHALLLQFLSSRPSHGIPFNQMFSMKQYPQEMLPLYAQSYSVVRFLVQQKGQQHFVRYVQAGLDSEQTNHPLRGWDRATRDHYGYDDLSQLQISWLEWVAAGSPASRPAPEAVAANRSPASPAGLSQSPVAVATPAGFVSLREPQTRTESPESIRLQQLPEDSWYRQQLTEPPQADQTLRRIDSTLQDAPRPPVRVVLPELTAPSLWR